MEKLKLIDEFIDIGNKMLNSNDFTNANKYIERFIRTFQNEIKNISDGLNAWYYSGKEGTSWEEDIQLVLDKLRNRKGDVLIEIDKIELKKMGISSVFNNYNSNENIQIMSMTFISVIESIKKCESLTSDQIKEIVVILSELEECKKDKKKVWVNIKQVLMWLADKAVDVGISVLPYVTGILSI